MEFFPPTTSASSQAKMAEGEGTDCKLTDTARFGDLHSCRPGSGSATGAIITPIYQTSTYVQGRMGAAQGFEYGRTQGPMALEDRSRGARTRPRGVRVRRAWRPSMPSTPVESGDHLSRERQRMRRHLPALRTRPPQVHRLHRLRRHVTARTNEPAITPKTMYSSRRRPTRCCASPDLAAASAIAHRHGVRVVVDGVRRSVSAAAGAQVRHRHPQHDEIPERPQRQRRRRRRAQASRTTSSG